jgi:glycosyltransferase involved in cell wall biosynthesis
MKKRGHGVWIASSGGDTRVRFGEAGIPYLQVPIKTKSEISPKVLVSLCKILPFIHKQHIDIIHANTRVTQVLGNFLQLTTRTPYVSTCHGFFKKSLHRKLFPCWGRKVIAISEPVKEHLITDFKVNEQDIAVIHNGIDIEKFGMPDPGVGIRKKKELGLQEGPVVGIIARLSDVKGHPYLIEAFKEVKVAVPSAQLLIAGEGNTRDDLVALTGDLGIEKNVFFVPNVHDTTDILSVTDIFVMPSLAEGLGLALMEAMASGLAVIGSDVGGIKSLIQDNKNGLLVKPKDVAGLASAMLALLRDPARRKELGINAKAYIRGNFSQEKMALETERVYLSCVTTKG